ncbi:MAG: OmpA family protein [Geminicoccaceae bacterium]|nr:OmpA family protein [Geminicoccaceae bacterium]
MTFHDLRRRFVTGCGVLGLGLLVAGSPRAQSDDKLVVYFDTGSSTVTGEGDDVLDQAVRLYREGSPIVMISAGGTDTVGSAESNLKLSVDRADAVVRGLVARGIPVGRLQVAGRGETELAVKTEDGVPERRNRSVEITWR